MKLSPIPRVPEPGKGPRRPSSPSPGRKKPRRPLPSGTHLVLESSSRGSCISRCRRRAWGPRVPQRRPRWRDGFVDCSFGRYVILRRSPRIPAKTPRIHAGQALLHRHVPSRTEERTCRCILIALYRLACLLSNRLLLTRFCIARNERGTRFIYLHQPPHRPPPPPSNSCSRSRRLAPSRVTPSRIT